MHRKKPFSGKKKKEQLKERRLRKAAQGEAHQTKENDPWAIEKHEDEPQAESGEEEGEDEDNNVHTKNNKEKEHKHTHSKNGDANKKDKAASPNVITPTHIPTMDRFPRGRLATIFEKESKEEVQARKKLGYLPLNMYYRTHPWWETIESETVLDIPRRPVWDYNMTTEQLEKQERAVYEEWMRNLLTQYGPRLNYFETNLEVWRQLWRVLERSDIILLVADSRFPLFHFPPALYNHVVKELKKPIILVLNKADIVDKKVVDAWEEYLLEKYPSLKIVRFSSFRPMAEGDLDVEKKRKFEKGRRKYENAAGRRKLLETIRSFNIVKKGKVVEIPELQLEKSEISSDEDTSDEDEDKEGGGDKEKEEKEDKERDYDALITIGTVGHPNVGKSSLINGLVGKKVVSTSATPGHTKHFQTIFLTPEILLCDCPGLVFPALDRPKDLQVLCGVFPIAQVREVFSAIRYLAERVPIEKIYNLKPAEENEPWSPYTICEAYALKRGYLLARTGAPDVHRAGGEILRDCLDGKIVISWPPPSSELAKQMAAAAEEKGKHEKNEENEEQENEEETADGVKESGEAEEEEEEGEDNSYRENLRKKRERKQKKKQPQMEEKPKPKKTTKKKVTEEEEDDDDGDKPSYYARLAAKQKRGGNKFKSGDL